MTKSLPLAFLVAAGLLSSTLITKASDITWNFNALGSDFSLSGTITGTALGNGSYKAVSGSGTFGTGLFAGTAANLVTFTTDNGLYGPFFTTGQWYVGGGFFAYTGQALHPNAASLLDFDGIAFSFTREGQASTIFLWSETPNYLAHVVDEFNNLERGSSNLTNNFMSQGGEITSFNLTNPTAAPEPSTYGIIGIAALGLAFAARRRKLKTA